MRLEAQRGARVTEERAGEDLRRGKGGTSVTGERRGDGLRLVDRLQGGGTAGGGVSLSIYAKASQAMAGHRTKDNGGGRYVGSLKG